MVAMRTVACRVLFILTCIPTLAEEGEREHSTDTALIIQRSSFFSPHPLGSIDLVHDADGFHVIKEGKQYDVQRCFVDKDVRTIESKKLAAFLKHGYLAVDKLGDDYSIKTNVRGPGGGPILAKIFYGATKTFCYGSLVGAATATVVTTGGAAAGAGMAAVGSSVATGTAISSAGAAAVGTAVGASASATAAVATTAGAALVAGGGTSAGVMGLIEAASITAGAIGAWIPWL